MLMLWFCIRMQCEESFLGRRLLVAIVLVEVYGLILQITDFDSAHSSFLESVFVLSLINKIERD